MADESTKYLVGANQLVGRLIQFIFSLYCGGQHIHSRPIAFFHSILQDLLAARTVPMFIHGRLYMAPISLGRGMGPKNSI